MKMKLFLAAFAISSLAVLAFTHPQPAPAPSATPPAAVLADSAPTAAAPVSTSGGLLAIISGLFLLGIIRGIVDQRESKTVALPAAGATAYTASLALGTGPHLERTEIQLAVPAAPDLVDAKTIIATLQDSADDVTFADLADLVPITLLGAGGNGAAAQTKTFRLPPSFRGYLRARFTVLAAGGDNTDLTGTLTPLH